MISSVKYFETLPLHPRPQPLESLTSYMIRLLEANGLQSLASSYFLFQTLQVTRGAVSKDHAPSSFGILPMLSQCSEVALRQMTFVHLERKLGHQGKPISLARSLAMDLRYCPICLAERAYRLLPWRFHALQGCSIHNCRLLDRCGHCGKTIPLFASPFEIATCPHCHYDLQMAPTEPLSQNEQVRAQKITRDLEFLLLP